MDQELVEDLMTVITHKPLARRLTAGVEVLTPRGYGVIVDVLPPIPFANSSGPAPHSIVVELEDDMGRAVFVARELQLAETVV